MGGHVYVDESKRRNYLLVASVHVGNAIGDDRKMMRGLVLPGQRRIHMAKESDSRRRAIAAAICGSGMSATVYDAGRRHVSELDARGACLEALIGDVARRGDDLLVIERDDSPVSWDRHRIYTLVRRAGAPSLRYEHRRARDEQLLSVPDAIAWCWAKGGNWRRRIEAAVSNVRQV